MKLSFLIYIRYIHVYVYCIYIKYLGDFIASQLKIYYCIF